jgi:hypothetical protein
VTTKRIVREAVHPAVRDRYVTLTSPFKRAEI